MATYDDISEDWDELANLFELEVNPLFGGTTLSGEHGSPGLGESPGHRISDWVGHDILAFMKFFDPTLPDDHPDNYYMEREWRCVRGIKFELADIANVFVAAGYQKQFTDRFATLASKVRELSWPSSIAVGLSGHRRRRSGPCGRPCGEALTSHRRKSLAVIPEAHAGPS